MPIPNGCRVVLLLTPPVFLLFPISVLIFVVDRIANSLLLAQTVRNFRSGAREITLYGPTSTGSSDFTNTDVTLRIDRGPTLAILGVCVIAFIVSALGAFGIWELKSVQGTARHQRVWSWIVLVSNMVMIGASAGILGYSSAVQGSENGWQRYEDVGKADQEFTRETWACQIDKFYPNQNWAGAACGTSKATRLLLIGMAVSSLLVIVSLWVLVRSRGGLKWLFGGKGRYGGFEDIYEMQPTGPHGRYAAQPIPQWSSQQLPQWTPQQVSYWGTQPAQPAQPWTTQPFQQGLQQGPPQTSPHMYKSGATTEQRAVFG